MSRVWPYVTPNDPMRQICENAQSDRKRHGFGHSIEQISVNWLYWNWFWRNARNVPETLVITCSFLILLARWLMEASGTYTDPTGGPLFLFSLCFAWEVLRESSSSRTKIAPRLRRRRT